MEKQSVHFLIEKYIAGSLQPDQQEELLKLINDDNPELSQVLNGLIAADSKKQAAIDPVRMQQILKNILSVDKAAPPAPVVKLNPVKKNNWWRAAAAVFILMLGIGTYLFNNEKGRNAVPGAKTDIQFPSSSKARIILADGRMVSVDSLNNGLLGAQGNINIVKTAGGQLLYEDGNGYALTEMQYNTLENPRGSTVIDITLNDGTRVWLNAGSSLRFPVAFTGNERKVMLTGEGYFEVAHNEAKKFTAVANGIETQVLGTHFNIKAYTDNDATKITLLEGAVKVQSTVSQLKLIPGQQAIAKAEQLKLATAVDTEEVMAWKNNLFIFAKASLPDVMKELSRWYDVEVKYEGNVPAKQFAGGMGRDLSLQQVLSILEKNNVHFEIKGKTIIVKN